MADDCPIVRKLRADQMALGCLFQKHGVTLKAVAGGSDIPYSTIRSYFPGERDAVPHALPLAAVLQLIGTVPNSWLSSLFADYGVRLVAIDDPARDPREMLEAVKASIDVQLAKLDGPA